MNKAQCKTCHAPIVFLKNENGSWCPCDPDSVQGIEDRTGPAKRGVHVLLLLESGAYVRCRRLLPGEPHFNQAVITGWNSHFSTCPNARRHRQ